MAKRRRNPAVVHQDQEDTSDLDFFSINSEGSPEKPVQRNAANARERARMRVLSKAFCRLKTSLPWVPPDTKLSKLDTLRLAATYISHLRKVLREDSSDDNLHTMPSNQRNCMAHPITMTWPFTINSKSSYSDYTSVPPIQEDNPIATDCSQDGMTDYRNLVPCEYMGMNQFGYQKKDTFGHHYLQ